MSNEEPKGGVMNNNQGLKDSLITRIRRRWNRVLKNRAGQSTTEYILILAIVVMIASKLKTTLKTLVEDKAMGTVTKQIDDFNNN